MIQKSLRRIKRAIFPVADRPQQVVEPSPARNAFSEAIPGHQAALDLYKDGWLSAMPEGSDLKAGTIPHFSDGRVSWAEPFIGGYKGKRILELGPFEAYNTFQFDRAGGDVLSIESSADNFLKCLIIKNAFGLRAEFLHGDFNLFKPDHAYDVVWASGVLYHLVDPIRFLNHITSWGDTLFIWTQYYDGSILTEGHPHNAVFDASKDSNTQIDGREIKLHWRSYIEAQNISLFAGGDQPFSYWMELDDILYILKKNGFGRIEMGFDNPHHPPGPACFFLAFRD